MALFLHSTAWSHGASTFAMKSCCFKRFNCFNAHTHSTRGICKALTHPATTPHAHAGLIDEEGGKRRLALDVDDALLKRKTRNIPRADVAALAVGCLGLAAAQNRAFDVCCDPAGEGEPSSDWEVVLGTLGGRNCDYAINSQADAAAPVTAA